MKIWRFSSFFDKESFVVEYVPLKIEIAYFFSEWGSCIVKEKKNSQTGGICMKDTYNKEYLMRDEKP